MKFTSIYSSVRLYREYKEINLFAWRVHEKINEVIERRVKQKFGQNLYLTVNLTNAAETMSQFHQHFTCSFCANLLLLLFRDKA